MKFSLSLFVASAVFGVDADAPSVTRKRIVSGNAMQQFRASAAPGSEFGRGTDDRFDDYLMAEEEIGRWLAVSSFSLSMSMSMSMFMSMIPRQLPSESDDETMDGVAKTTPRNADPTAASGGSETITIQADVTDDASTASVSASASASAVGAVAVDASVTSLAADDVGNRGNDSGETRDDGTSASETKDGVEESSNSSSTASAASSMALLPMAAALIVGAGLSMV